MAPFVSALDTFHESTRPSTWLEGLVKAYVGDGLATDFYREIASFLPDPDRALVLDVLADTGHADFAVREVRAAIAANRRVAGRLALWGRRLVGEAMTQSQAVIAEHDRLAELIVGGTGDLGGRRPPDPADHRRAHRAHEDARPQPLREVPCPTCWSSVPAPASPPPPRGGWAGTGTSSRWWPGGRPRSPSSAPRCGQTGSPWAGRRRTRPTRPG